MARRPVVHTRVTSKKVPKAEGPSVHAVHVAEAGGMLFVSGQVGLESNGKLSGGPIRKQSELALNHLRNIVVDAGFHMDELTRVTVYMTDTKNMAIFDEVYQKMFVGSSLPARSTIKVSGLSQDALVMVEATAVKAAPPQAAMQDLPQEPDPYY